MKKNRFIVFLFLIGIVFSLDNIIYSVKDYFDDSFDYIAIRQADDFIYYPHFREVIDWNVPSTDPDTYENKEVYSQWITFSLSSIISGIGGVFTGNIEHAYYFNNFFLPIINFLLIYFLFYLIIGNKNASIFFATFILLFNRIMVISFPYINIDRVYNLLFNITSIQGLDRLSEYTRAPNIMFSNIPFFLFAISLYKIINNYKPKWLIIGFLSLGATTYSYLPVSILSYFIILTAIVFYFKNGETIKKLIYLFFLGLIISSPAIFILFSELYFKSEFALDQQFADQMVNFYQLFPQKHYNIHLDLLLKVFYNCMMMILNVFLVLLFTINNKRFNLIIVVGSLISYAFMMIIFGYKMDYQLLHVRTMYRGIMTLNLVVLFSIIYENFIYYKSRINNTTKSSLNVLFRENLKKTYSVIINNRYTLGISLIIIAILFNEFTFRYFLHLSFESHLNLSTRFNIVLFQLFFLISGLFIVTDAAAISKIIKKCKNTIYSKNKLWTFSYILLMVAMLVQVNYYGRFSDEIDRHNDTRNMKKLFTWLEKNTKRDEVALTMDGEISILLPSYTHLNLYVPINRRSVTGMNERLNRLYEGMRYLGVTSEMFKYILSNSRFAGYSIPQNNNFVQSNLNLINLVLFHRQYKKVKIDEERINKLINEYENKLNLEKKFTYKIDYLITSKFDSALSKLFSNYLTTNFSELLYSNSEFSVFKINDLKGI